MYFILVLFFFCLEIESCFFNYKATKPKKRLEEIEEIERKKLQIAGRKIRNIKNYENTQQFSKI